jgi:hypothetical protein
MTWIVTIDKSGKVSEKNHTGGCDTLYKKCNLRKPDGFSARHVWKVRVGDDIVFARLWAKTEGKAGCENKFELPPPVDTTLFFGTMAIALTDGDQSLTPSMDLRKKSWAKVYEALYGGFEDLGQDDDDDDEEEDELACVPDELKTKAGYLKDGFVVSGGESEDEEDGGGDLSEESEEDGSEEEILSSDDGGDDDGDTDIAATVAGFSECSEEEYDYSDDD